MGVEPTLDGAPAGTGGRRRRARRRLSGVDRRLYVAAHGVILVAFGLAFLHVADTSTAWSAHLPAPWLAIAVCFFVVEATALHIEIRRETHSLSLSGIPLLLGLLSLSPIPLLLARLVGNSVALVAVRRRSGLKLFWNLALYTAETGVAAAIASVALAGGKPATMGAWTILLVAVLVAELIGLVSVPIVIMVAESELRLSLFGQIGRSQLIATVSSTFGTVTAAAMIELPWLALFAFVPLAGVATLLRMFGRLGKEHHDLRQLHSFTNAIAGRNTLDAGLLQLTTILRASSACLAVRADGGAFNVRVHRNQVAADDTVLIAEGPRPGPGAVAVIGPGSAPSEPGALIAALGGSRGLAIRIGDHAGGEAYILLIDRLGASEEFGEDEIKLFGSLATALGARLSADRLLDQLETQARTDALTGLANRAMVEEALEARLRDEDGSGSVLLLDLDRFKDVNDSLGHQFGDELLQLVAERLQQHTRSDDLVGRLGGDEFAIILADDAPGDLERQLTSLADRLTAPVDLDGITLEVGTSMGVASWPKDAAEPHELLRLADIAMYEAKRTHQSWIRYDPDIDHASADRLALLGQIRGAITRRELVIHVQPQLRTTDLALIGCEALIRWNHPERGMIPPGEFLPLAEQSSLAGAITEHVVDEAIAAVAHLDSAGHDLTVWVNLTARDVLDTTLAPAVATAILASGIQPSRLGFEVTESSVIVNIETAIANLEALRRLGCRTSVDDFGTGFASLQYLQRLPVDEVKIDQSFVTDMANDPDSASIVRATTRLVHDLGMEVVAEGIEDERTVELLREIGCDTLQGYHLGKPMDLERFLAWAAEHRSLTDSALR